MAPRSPTHAFDPTPALEHNRQNFSPLNKSFDEFDDHMASRGVHFSDPPVSMAARHSIATTHVPLLESVASASRIPKQAFRITDPSPGIDINAYIENCRNLNEQLRTAHDTERRAWEIERTAMKAQIAELEFRLNKARDPKRRSSNDSSAASAQSFKADFRNTYLSNGVSGSGARKASDSALISGPPVWRGPESTPPVTRVFSNENDMDHLPSISEDEPFPTLSRDVSPTNRAANRAASVSVPIETIDETLDGVNLRSHGLTSSFSARVSSPRHSPNRSPSPKPPRNTMSAGGSLAVDMDRLLDPLDRKLTRHAGHTPMAFDGALSASNNTTNVPSPRADDPPEPVPTARPPMRPSEYSDSFFSPKDIEKPEHLPPETIAEEVDRDHAPQHETEDDPPLTGPLMLDSSAKSQAATNFLDQVDAKLMEAAARPRSDTISTDLNEAPPIPPVPTGAATTGAVTNGTKSVGEDAISTTLTDSEKVARMNTNDDMPQLKMKKSTNFGSAWGKAW